MVLPISNNDTTIHPSTQVKKKLRVTLFFLSLTDPLLSCQLYLLTSTFSGTFLGEIMATAANLSHCLHNSPLSLILYSAPETYFLNVDQIRPDELLPQHFSVAIFKHKEKVNTYVSTIEILPLMLNLLYCISIHCIFLIHFKVNCRHVLA